jgi:hypothetical protein
MAVCHCYSWWRWWSETLWATLIRLWLQPVSCYLQIVVEEISLQFHTCVMLQKLMPDDILPDKFMTGVRCIDYKSVCSLILLLSSLVMSPPVGIRVHSAILCDYGPATYAWFAKTGQLWRHLRCYFGQSIFHKESLWFVWVGGWMKLKPWPTACCSGPTSQPATALDSEPCVLLFEPRSKLVNSMDACPGWYCCWFIDAFLGMSWD